MRRLKIVTWHTHGAYLLYLAQAPHDFYVLSRPDRPAGYTGRWGHLPWGDNVHDLPVADARRQRLDCILFQDDAQYLHDQHEILSPEQRRLPKIYLEHDPPCERPVDQRHFVQDPDALLVHVTHFNQLMWDSGVTPARVVEHGVIDPGYRYTGELARGLVVVNHLHQRGRRLGADVYERLRTRVPLDLVGMGTAEHGGLGEVLHGRLAEFSGRYRFFFNPIRHTSLGLAVIEAMMAGLPIVALATTEMSTVIQDGVNGFIHTDLSRLAERMDLLLRDADLARRMGACARQTALERFGIARFAAEWHAVFREAVSKRERSIA